MSYVEHVVQSRFKHVSFWYLFLEPNRSTYHHSIGILIRNMTERGLSTVRYVVLARELPTPLIVLTVGSKRNFSYLLNVCNSIKYELSIIN